MFRNLTIAAAMTVGVSAANAAVVDLTALGSGDLGDRKATIGGVMIDAPGAGASLSVGADNSICSTSGGACGGNLKFNFDEVATNLMLNINGAGSGGPVVVIAESGPGGARTFANPDANGMVDFSSVAGVTSVFVGNQSGGAVSVSDLKFGDDTTPAPAPIPLPATLPLLLAGLGGFALMRRRKG